uniref:Uncharacterized protein n=1 Tax=Haptolina brevifila TaxID=156173 RepID=A0A7S2NGJ0_9EUKA
MALLAARLSRLWLLPRTPALGLRPLRAPHGAADVAELHAPRSPANLALPAITAAFTLLPNLIPAILLTGKGKSSGKSKRMPKPANHGSRPCNHVGRRQRAAARGRYKYQPKR